MSAEALNEAIRLQEDLILKYVATLDSGMFPRLLTVEEMNKLEEMRKALNNLYNRRDKFYPQPDETSARLQAERKARPIY